MMPTRQAQAVEDGAHPLRVALGQVVVDRDDVDAAAGHRVERGCERCDEGLALAGASSRRSCPGAAPCAPMSCTSKWRMPSLRRLISRAAANTSGSASSRTPWRCLMSSFSRARRSSRRRSELSLRRARPRMARRARRPRGSRRAARSCARGSLRPSGPGTRFERVDLVDERLETFDDAFVRVDETGNDVLHGPSSIGGGINRPVSRGRGGRRGSEAFASTPPGTGTRAQIESIPEKAKAVEVPWGARRTASRRNALRAQAIERRSRLLECCLWRLVRRYPA